MTQPSHTAPPAPADHTLLFSHNPHEMQKWGAKLSTGTAAARGAELSVSLSSGQEQPGKLVLPATRDPAERRRVCKLFPYSHAFWSWIRPSFPKALGDANHRSRVHPVSRRGPEAQHPAVQGAAARVLLQVPPPVPPPAVLHLPRMWLRWGHLYEEPNYAVFFQEAKPAPLFFLKC